MEAKAVATNLSRTTTTDAEGNYTLTSLPVGEYEVTISTAGFRKEVQRGITIQVQQRARLDVALQPGNVTETINAVGAAPVVNTEDGVFGLEIGPLRYKVDRARAERLRLTGKDFSGHSRGISVK